MSTVERPGVQFSICKVLNCREVVLQLDQPLLLRMHSSFVWVFDCMQQTLLSAYAPAASTSKPMLYLPRLVIAGLLHTFFCIDCLTRLAA